MEEPTSKQLELVRMYIGNLVGLKSIGKKIHSDPRTFKKEITEFGIDVLPIGSQWVKIVKHFRGEFYCPISSKLEEILCGALLGDGQLRLQTKGREHKDGPALEEYKRILREIDNVREKTKQKLKLSKNDVQNWNYAILKISHTNTANFRIHKSIFELEWVKFFKEILSKELSLRTYVKPINNPTTKWTCGFDTSSSIQLYNLWRKWYKTKDGKKIKILPNLEEITPDILLHWYLDDGYMSGYDISLCSQSFSIEENKKLVSLLKLNSINSKIRFHKTKPFINISSTKENKKNFFNLLDKAKYIKEAELYFPFKFTNSISKKEWKDIQLKKHPEYQLIGEKIRKKLNDFLK